MLPTIETAGDAEHRRLADSIAGAVADSGVPHVVMLSSIGAELADGTGPIRWLHHLEDGLRQTGAVVSAIRSWHFQEKVETLLGAALGAGIYPVFGESADVPTPMIATRDIGRVAAETLLEPPACRRDHRPRRALRTPNETSPTSWQPRSASPSRSSPSPGPAGWAPWSTPVSRWRSPTSSRLSTTPESEASSRPAVTGQVACTTPIDETLRHVVEAANDQTPAA